MELSETQRQPGGDMRAIECLTRKLQMSNALGADDLTALQHLPIVINEIPAYAAIVREGDRPAECGVLIEGFVCRSKSTDAGKRQILSVHIPGDIPDLESLHLHVMDHDVTTLSRSVIGFIPHEMLRAVIRARPTIAEAIWRETLIDAAIFREWIVNVGRRPALARLAHFLAEMGFRLQAIGIASDDRFELPMRQTDIADALGLTPVHINRAVKELRRAGLLELRKHYVFLPNLPRLKELAGFNDLYLHQLRRGAQDAPGHRISAHS